MYENSFWIVFCISFSVAQQPSVSQDFLIIEASPSHSDTPHWVGLLYMSDQPDQRPMPYNTQHSQETVIHCTKICFSFLFVFSDSFDKSVIFFFYCRIRVHPSGNYLLV